MARTVIALRIPGEVLALAGYRHLTQRLREELDRPEWERIDMEALVEIMEGLAREADGPGVVR